jgi:hypothetical protein
MVAYRFMTNHPDQAGTGNNFPRSQPVLLLEPEPLLWELAHARRPLPLCCAPQATHSTLPMMIFPCICCAIHCMILWYWRPPLLHPLPCYTHLPTPIASNPPTRMSLHHTYPLGPLHRLRCRPLTNHSLIRMGSRGYPATCSTSMRVRLLSLRTLTGYPTSRHTPPPPSAESDAMLTLSSYAEVTMLPPGLLDSLSQLDAALGTNVTMTTNATDAIHNLCARQLLFCPPRRPQ